MKRKLSILSISLITVMAGAAVSPALGEISSAFPEASQTTVKLVNTLHALFIIPFTFVCSMLTKRFSKKSILLVGLMLYMIGGIGGGFATNIGVLLFTRALLGVAVGLIMPISTSLVSDFYEGEERTAMMGRVGASNQLGGMISIATAGVLASISWRFTFGVYALALLVFVLVFLYLPKQPVPKVEKEKRKTSLNKQVYGLAFAMFTLFIFFYSIPTNMAIYLQENHIATTAVIGFILPISSLGGFIGGMLLGQARALLQSFLTPIQICFIGIGFCLIGFTSHVLPIAIGVFILGLGFGTLVPMIFNGVAKVTSGLQVVAAMAIVQSFMYLGQFMSPIVLDALSSLLGNNSNKFIYEMAAVMTLSLGVIFLVATYLKKGTDSKG